MVFSIPEQSRQLVANLERVTGPVTQMNDFWEPGPWMLRAEYQGRALLVVIHTDDSVLDGISFGTWLGDRPIALTVHDTRTTILGVPVVPTGDHAFDASFVVNGWPAEVLREVLDAQNRRWLLDTWSGRDPQIRTQGGYLLHYEHLRVMEGVWAKPSGRVPEVQELTSWLNRSIQMADRLTGAFDRAHAAVAAGKGHEAAARWVQTHVEATQSRATRRKTLRIIVFSIIGAFIALPLIAVALFLLSVLVCSDVSFSTG